MNGGFTVAIGLGFDLAFDLHPFEHSKESWQLTQVRLAVAEYHRTRRGTRPLTPARRSPSLGANRGEQSSADAFLAMLPGALRSRRTRVVRSTYSRAARLGACCNDDVSFRARAF
jgi:hypothetical protein